MPGLVPGIHVSTLKRIKDVDGQDKPAHNGRGVRKGRCLAAAYLINVAIRSMISCGVA